MIETQRLPPIPDELTSAATDPTTKIWQKPDGTVIVHSIRAGVEGKLHFKADGSFGYTSNTGSTVNFHANNQIDYAKGGITISVDNHFDVKISGHNRISIDTDAHIEVAKNASIAINGDTEVYSTGHLKMIGADVYIGSTKGSVVINGARDIEVTATQGRITHHSSGVQTFTTTSGDFHVDTAGMVDLNSQLDSTITAQGNVTTTSQSATNINAQGSLTTNSQSTTTINSSGNITTQGAQTLLQGGGASSPPITVT